MKIYLLFLSFLFFLAQPTLKAQPLSVIDTIWGTPVADPYRWLEDLDSDTVKTWLKQQQKITKKEKGLFFDNFYRINQKLMRDGFASFPDFTKQGPFYFMFAYTSGNPTPVLYYKKQIDGKIEEAYNSNNFRDNFSNLDAYALSNDAKYLAVALSKTGKIWQTIKIRNLKKGQNLPDVIERVKSSNLVWTEDGFFYSKFKSPPQDSLLIASNTQQELYFHKLGDLQEQDKLIYAIPDEANTFFHFEETSDHQYLIFYSATKLKGEWYNTVSYKDLKKGIYAPINILVAIPKEEDVHLDVVDMIGDTFLIQTNIDAPFYQVLSCHKDSINSFERFIPEYKKVLKTVRNVGGKLLAIYFSKGQYLLGIFDYQGNLLHNIKFPEGIRVSGFQGEALDSTVDFSLHSFYYPTIVHRLNLNTYKAELVDTTRVYYNVQGYMTEIVNYKSKDGTEIPIYLTHKKDLKRSDKNPVILHGWGTAGQPIMPFYNFANILFFENNGILAVPMIRGGGEFGREWHNQGKLLNKQNSFDDFAHAAEFLIDSGYTSANRIAIRGNSYGGGLLVGAMLTQHPDLFKVAIIDNGVYDMLRYHLFTTGRFLHDEYGTVNDSIEFRNLLKYSPLHNINSSTDYPATLLLVDKNNDIIPALHTYKFLATLQKNTLSHKPHILYFEDGNSVGTIYSREAFILAFLFKQMGIEYPVSEF